MNNVDLFKNLVSKTQAAPLPSGQPVATPAAGMQAAGFTPAEAAAGAGRLGDTILAHLTPGEITVPPQVQTPKVLAALKEEFSNQSVDPSQFVAGSQNSSTNPQTGMPEYNFWSSFLPIALGIGGSVAAPMLAPALGMSAGTLGAIGGGLGTTVGGLATGQDATSALITGGLSGLGSYGLGQLMSPAATAATNAGANATTQAASDQAINSVASGAFPTGNSLTANSLSAPAQSFLNPIADQTAKGVGPTVAAASSSAPIADSFRNLWGILPEGQNIGNVAGGFLGSQLGNAITQKPDSTTNQPNYPAGFNEHATDVKDLGSYQDLLGTTTSKSPRANFTNYNPFTLSPNAYNFYPRAV